MFAVLFILVMFLCLSFGFIFFSSAQDEETEVPSSEGAENGLSYNGGNAA